MLQVHLGTASFLELCSSLASVSPIVSGGVGFSDISKVSDTEAVDGESKRHASKKLAGTSKMERYRFSCGVEVVCVVAIGGQSAAIVVGLPLGFLVSVPKRIRIYRQTDATLTSSKRCRLNRCFNFFFFKPNPKPVCSSICFFFFLINYKKNYYLIAVIDLFIQFLVFPYQYLICTIINLFVIYSQKIMRHMH